MRQALHIFRKDLRHLWPQIAIVLALVAAYAVLAGRTSDDPFTLDRTVLQTWEVISLLGFLVPVAYAWLIITLVHQEALPGSRQFWVTRPYRAGRLIAAKVLFVVLFVTVSMVAKDWYIVAAHGFPVLPDLTGLLLRLAAWTAWVVLPALAAGVVTRNLQEVGLLGAGLVLVYALENVLAGQPFWRGSCGYADGTEWIRDFAGVVLLVIACTAIFLWQYWRRQTVTARVAVACCSLLMLVGVPLLPWKTRVAVQMLMTRPRVDVSGVRIEPDLARPRPVVTDREDPPEPYVTIVLPVRVTGLRSDLRIATDGALFDLYSGGRRVARSGGNSPSGLKAESYTWEMFSLDRATYRLLKAQPVRIKVSLSMTVLEDEPAVSVPAHTRAFGYAGSRCLQPHPEKPFSPIWCVTALKEAPRTLVAVSPAGIAESMSQDGTWSYAAYPVPLDMSPIYRMHLLIYPRQDGVEASRVLWERPDTRIILTPQQPVAHFRRELEFTGVRLADYVRHVRAELKVIHTPQ